MMALGDLVYDLARGSTYGGRRIENPLGGERRRPPTSGTLGPSGRRSKDTEAKEFESGVQRPGTISTNF